MNADQSRRMAVIRAIRRDILPSAGATAAAAHAGVPVPADSNGRATASTATAPIREPQDGVLSHFASIMFVFVRQKKPAISREAGAAPVPY